MVNVNSRVIYAQLEMFDKELVGKIGTVLKLLIKPPFSKDAPVAQVLFDNIGLKAVPVHCLMKINE